MEICFVLNVLCQEKAKWYALQYLHDVVPWDTSDPMSSKHLLLSFIRTGQPATHSPDAVCRPAPDSLYASVSQYIPL